MKTLKFAVIAAIVACTMVSLSYADGFKEKPKPVKVINLTLEKAAHIPGLVVAMYDQIDKDDLLNSTNHILVAEVTYLGTLYRITGTLEQWILFFKFEGGLPFNQKNPIVGSN
jgi:hypothetical protein